MNVEHSEWRATHFTLSQCVPTLEICGWCAVVIARDNCACVLVQWSGSVNRKMTRTWRTCGVTGHGNAILNCWSHSVSIILCFALRSVFHVDALNWTSPSSMFFMNEHRLTRVRLVGPLSLGNSLYWKTITHFWVETAHGMKRGSLNHDDHGLQQNLCKPLNMFDNVVQRSGMNVWSYQHHCVTGESHSWLFDCKCDANGRVDKAQTNLKRCGVNMMVWLNQHDGHWQTARVTFNNRDHWHSLRATKCLKPFGVAHGLTKLLLCPPMRRKTDANPHAITRNTLQRVHHVH